MNLRQLQHVVALAEQRNFRRAADAVGLTQSALTQSIRKLEEEYGVELFERSRRDVSPTAYGLTVIQSARHMLSQLANLRRELDLMKNLQSGRLIVGCDAWLAEGLLGPALGRMLSRYPDLRFSVRVGAVDELIDNMLSGAVDLYVGPPPELRDHRIEWLDITLPPMVLVCNPEHPLLQLASPSAVDCLAYPIAAPILPKWYAAWLGRQIGDPMTPEGRDIYSFFVESDDIGIIRGLVRTTELITSLPSSMAAEEVARGQMRTIPLAEMNFPIPAVIGYPSTRPIAPAGDVLVRELLAEVTRLADQPGAARPSGPLS